MKCLSTACLSRTVQTWTLAMLLAGTSSQSGLSAVIAVYACQAKQHPQLYVTLSSGWVHTLGSQESSQTTSSSEGLGAQ